MLELVYVWVHTVFYKMIKLKGIINDWTLQFGDSYCEEVQKTIIFWKQLELIKLPAETPIHPNLERHFAITSVGAVE